MSFNKNSLERPLPTIFKLVMPAALILLQSRRRSHVLQRNMLLLFHAHRLEFDYRTGLTRTESDIPV